MSTLIGVMPKVLMETTVLVLVSFFYWSIDWFWPLQGGIFPYLHQDLLNWHY